MTQAAQNRRVAVRGFGGTAAPGYSAKPPPTGRFPTRTPRRSPKTGSHTEDIFVSTPVTSERQGAVAILTLNRPDVLNSLDRATLEALSAAVAEIAADESVRAVVLTGAGRAFAAGADIEPMSKMTPLEGEAFGRLGHAAFASLEALDVPTIAAVNGFALGGGCELALACDFIYASSKARFGQPEVNLGLLPGFGGTSRLVRRVGVAWAKEIILGGENLKADEALRIGLADTVTSPEELMDKVRETASRMIGNGPCAVAEAKRVIQEGVNMTLAQGNLIEQMAFASLFATSDQKEGMAAFLGKRSPEFRGE
jgi:enoyl-CoA hydratase